VPPQPVFLIMSLNDPQGKAAAELPSALDCFDAIGNEEGLAPAVFLNFDGTLALG